MHPIEYLRYLARAGDAPPSWLVPEAAEALGGLVGDRNGLVLGCRKLLEHHPLCGPMWWLCAHTLTTRNAQLALDDLVERFEQDPTPLQVSLALSEVSGTGDEPAVLEACLAGSGGVVVRASDAALRGDESVWVTVGLGTVVPDQVFAATLRKSGLAGRSGADADGALRSDYRLVSLDDVARVIRPTGVGGTDLVRSKPDMPFVPELLARG